MILLLSRNVFTDILNKLSSMDLILEGNCVNGIIHCINTES